ncbi:MAG: hypothetical protein KA314_02530 [Chloroflexi bacterium]|nr:hypothetical protein [Chloroflexota bacterium]MBP8054684.1 hypothetical protein [Chloroflexota bacterium]
MVDLTQYSLTIPNPPEFFISRTNWVNWIHDRFSDSRKMIIVQSPDGTGKTTLLAQFARTYSDSCFCFFVKPDQYVSTPKRFYQELCRQMQIVLTGKEDDLVEKSDFRELKRLFGDLYYQIGRKARKEDRSFFFVIDGLEWTTDKTEQENISYLLPSEPYSKVYVLASSRPGQNFNFKYESENCPLFSEQDTAKYFELASIELEKEMIDAIFGVCNGMPGYLDQLCREILASGKEIEDVVKQLPKGFKELLERNWESLKIRDVTRLQHLAVLAYSRIPLTASTLSKIVATPEETLVDFFTPIPFIHCADTIRFVTDAHKQFVAEKLKEHQGIAESWLIDFYSADPYHLQSLEVLPILLKESKRFDVIKDLVTTEYLTRTLQEQRDMFLLNRNLQLVTEVTKSDEDWQAMSKYVLMSSILSTITSEVVLGNEVDAFLSLNDYEHSFKLASQALLPEDRLQLLARIGNRMIHEGESVPEIILSGLEQSVSQVNITDSTKDRMLEIITDLFYVHPQVASDLVNKLVGRDTKDKTVDLLLAMLTAKLEDNGYDQADALRTRISDKKLQDFTRANSSVVAAMSAQKVLAEAKKIDDVSSKVFLLRSWCNSNRTNFEAVDVVREALEIMTASDSNLSIRYLRQFAEPLVHCLTDEVTELVERIDLLKETAIQNPAEEKVRLELILAHIEAKNAKDDRATDRFYLTFYDLDEKVTDSDIRCYGLTRMLLSLPKIKPDDLDLRSYLEKCLREEFNKLLDLSADHLSLTRHLLSPLTNYDPQMALEFAEKLNFAQHRDLAKSRIMVIYCDRKIELIDFDFLAGTVESISRQDLRNWTYVHVLEQITKANKQNSMPLHARGSFQRFAEKIQTITDPIASSFAYTYSLKIYGTHDRKVAHSSYEKMKKSWDAIDQSWERVQLGFDLVTLVAESDNEWARNFLEKVRECRAGTILNEGTFAELFIGTLQLMIRCVPSLVKNTSAIYQNSKLKIQEMISTIPSSHIKGLLFAELAMRLKLAEKDTEFKDIVKNNILPVLDNLQDQETRLNLLVQISPCLFEYERSLLFDEISGISTYHQDRALMSVLKYILSNCAIGDPVDLDSLNANMDYQRASTYCDVLERISTDTFFYTSTEYLVDALIQTETIKKGQKIERCILNEKQALRIGRRLIELIDKKLPDLNNIRHEGYKIAAYAIIAQLRSSATENEKPHRAYEAWQKLVLSWGEIANNVHTKISNSADRALVLTWVGRKMYWSNMQLATQLLEKAKQVIDIIPNVIDRSGRLSALAEAWSEVDQDKSAKVFLKEAMAILNAWSWDGAKDEVTGKILEVANTIDPEFAAGLVSTVDNPLLKHEFEQKLEVKKLKKEPRIVDEKDSNKESNYHLYSELAGQLLISLCSGKGQTLPQKFVLEATHSFLNASFEEVYNLLSWSIQNELTKTKMSNVATLTDLYNGLLDSLYFTLNLGMTLSRERSELGYFYKNIPAPASLQLFSVGTQVEALAALKDWLQSAVVGYLKIYDPYFTQDELHILKSVPSNVSITILTSWKAQTGITVGDIDSLRLKYLDTWNNTSDQNMPPTRLYLFGIKSSGDSPLHERYYVSSEGRGLRLGTSQSGLGKKDTDIRAMGAEETQSIERERIDKLILYPPFEYKNERLISSVLTF